MNSILIIKRCALAILFLFVNAPLYAQGNLVLNGSFEDGVGGVINTNGSDPEFPHWNVQEFHSGNGVILGVQGAGLPPSFPDGARIAVFTYDGGSISQTLATVPGVYYALTFSAIQFSGTNAASVTIDGSLLGGIQYQNYSYISPILVANNPEYFHSVWENFNFGFVASGSQTVLSFIEYPDTVLSPDQTYYWGRSGIDNVSVFATPEPSVLALLGLGVAFWFIRQRRGIASSAGCIN